MAKIEKRRPTLSHLRFAILFSAVLYAICNAPNAGKLAHWFRHRGGYDIPALSAYLLAGWCLFLVFFLLLAHRWTIKPFAALLILVSGTTTYFISKYDVAIDTSMVRNALHTDSTEVGQLLSPQMIPYVVFLMALPIACLVPLRITFARGGRYLLGSLKLGALALAVALVVLYSNFRAIHQAGNVSNKYIVYSLVPINVITGTLSVASKALKPHLIHEKPIEISGRIAETGDLVVVLAVGESSRRSSFSVYGYERRDTNPVLRTIPGLHLLAGRAKRGSTLDALPEILEKEGAKLPQIVSRLGIPTRCFVNYTLYDNCLEPGETKVSNCGHAGKCYDEDVVPLLESDLATYRSGYRFIVLHLGGGSHGPTYVDRYPPEFQRFEPLCRDADVANECTQEELLNSYDNTILYVDFVLGEIVARLERSGVPYVLIYLSDHGESLLEEGRMFHGMPPGISLPPEQAEVPLIVKASVPIRIAERAEYTQQQVFATVLDLFSIETRFSDPTQSFVRRAEGPPARSAPDQQERDQDSGGG